MFLEKSKGEALFPINSGSLFHRRGATDRKYLKTDCFGDLGTRHKGGDVDQRD